MKKHYMDTQRIDSENISCYNTSMNRKNIVLFFCKSNSVLEERVSDLMIDSFIINAFLPKKEIEEKIDNLLMDNRYLNHPNLTLIFVDLAPETMMANTLSKLYNAQLITMKVSE